MELSKLKAVQLQERTARLWAGGRVMPGRVQRKIQGADVGEEDIAAVGLDIGIVAAVGEED